MMKVPSPLTTINNFLNYSLRRIILVTLIAVSLIPLAFVLPSLGETSWESIYKDNLEKHKILATSLIEPIKLHIESFQHDLKLLDITLQSSTFEDRQNTQRIINQFINSKNNVVSVSLLLLSDSNSPIVEVNNSLKRSYKKNPKTPEYIANEIRYQKYGKKNSISSIFKSSLSKTPALLIKHQIIDRKFNKIGTLFVEIEPKFIQMLCSNISFGNKGLCAIVDNKNKIVAHPDQAWVSQLHDLSSHKLVKTLKSNNIGSLEYISSIDNREMIGGYAKIKSLNWGIIVTRPKSEINLPLNSIRTNTLIWLVTGLVLALGIAIIVILNVTRPLQILSNKAKVLAQKQSTYSLGDAPKNSSSDILSLWKTLSDLLADYQDINNGNTILETSSKKDIRKVMSKLREENTKNSKNIDPATGVTNSVCFMEELRKSLSIFRGEMAGLIIVEVDNYKPLIEKGNTQLANYILKHVADILSANKRDDDMVARYGNEGHFAIFINDCNSKALKGMARKLRSLVETSPIQWEENTIYINLSTGLVAHEISEQTTVETLISFAEEALNISKSVGENKISTNDNEDAQTT